MGEERLNRVLESLPELSLTIVIGPSNRRDTVALAGLLQGEWCHLI